MRVLIVSCVYAPEPVVSAKTTAGVAEGLAQRGHAVTLVTSFPSRPSGHRYSGHTRALYKRESDPAGFEVIRCFSVPSPRSSLVSRFLENISFGVTSGLVVLFASRPNVIYANTWPIFAAGILALIARLRHVPLVMSVQDLYPESLISQRRISAQSWIARLMAWTDGQIAQSCRALIVISDHFASVYSMERHISAENVHVVPNWDEDTLAGSGNAGRAYRKARGILPPAFVATYSGSIGAGSGVESFVNAARHLSDSKQTYLVIAGEGGHLAACQSLAREVGYPRLIFHTPYPVEDTAEVLDAADVLILPTPGAQSLASVPSKLITYMLAARPIIAAALPQSDLAQVMERSGCGWVIPPDQPKKLAEKILEIIELPGTELAKHGQAGRDYALKNFVGEVCLPRVIQVVEQAAV